jgi:hypothetical protein
MMADIEPQLVTVLESVTPGAVFPLLAQQSQTGDYLTYHNVANKPRWTLENGAPISNTIMQIDCWSDSYAGAKALAASAALALEGWSVQNVPGTSRDLYEEAIKKFRVSLDYSIWWN